MSTNSEALSSRWLPLILLHGAPPPHPGYNSLKVFANYIHDLAVWTNECRLSYMEWEGIDPDDGSWAQDYNRCKRKAFEDEFIEWAYTLKPEEYPDGT